MKLESTDMAVNRSLDTCVHILRALDEGEALHPSAALHKCTTRHDSRQLLGKECDKGGVAKQARRLFPAMESYEREVTLKCKLKQGTFVLTNFFHKARHRTGSN